MRRVLADAKSASETAADAGVKKVPRKEASDIVRRYHDALDVAFALLPKDHHRGDAIQAAGRTNNAPLGTSPPICGLRPSRSYVFCTTPAS
jgi:hypothetical protein